MKRGWRSLLLAALGATSLCASAAMLDSPSEDVRRWDFRVYLDNSEIGYHRFELVGEQGRQRVTTEAEFRVRFLFLTAYRYEHSNEETWEDNCLREIDSQTDDNGRQFAVRGLHQDDRFALLSARESLQVPGCVKTFAYWNPAILEEDQLMNSQTGELLPVTVEKVARERLDVRGEPVSAVRYRLLARNLELDLWYSDDDEWLALESTLKGGRKLRYELT